MTVPNRIALAPDAGPALPAQDVPGVTGPYAPIEFERQFPMIGGAIVQPQRIAVSPEPPLIGLSPTLEAAAPEAPSSSELSSLAEAKVAAPDIELAPSITRAAPPAEEDRP